MSRLILFIDPIWDCPLLCEEDHWSCTASDHLYSCAQTRHCGDCPVCFGPWGAWRAGLAVVEDAARHEGEMGNLKRIALAIDTLGAVGWWSP